MVTFTKDKANFTHRVAAIVLHDDHVLLHQAVEDDFWVLPGGRVELLESAQDSICREMEEELGAKVKVERLVWVLENFFHFQGLDYHELGLYFLTSLPQDSPLFDKQKTHIGIEDCSFPSAIELVFRWFPLAELDRVAIQPTFLQEALKRLPDETTYCVHRDRAK